MVTQYLASALELARERVIKAQEEEARALALCGVTPTHELPNRLCDCCAETDRLCSEYASLVRQWWLSMRSEAKPAFRVWLNYDAANTPRPYCLDASTAKPHEQCRFVV